MMPRRITEDQKITDFFGSDVFSETVMEKYLDKESFEELTAVIKEGGVLHRSLADKVAPAMMRWAVEKGATHYTHWFQPLTGTTAEKHESFISLDGDNRPIMEFSGKNLTKGETDASSFPSGGIRATFEARGYTVWDCSSPAFIKRNHGGASILYIPTAFCAYTGHALDNKTPLLRSMEALNREGIRLLGHLGETVKRVVANVGAEQEYFLISKSHFMMREDLKYAGRTLFGAPPAKGQEKNDQYYGVIRDRVSAYMADLNIELWKLGITAKTEHNEAAPAQHEIVPIYATANIATDQNQLMMEVMKKVAEKHDLAMLLHEKPFNGVNGSGKHNNWSLWTDAGVNLLDPGVSPAENIKFLLFFIAVLAGVDEYADFLRMSTAHAGNDCRLGGNEAPPCVISAFVGDMLEEVINSVEAGTKGIATVKEYIKVGVSSFPKLKKDNSDRNRTSPFAFTGNKFEFRMVGSSASLAAPNIALNTITAEMLKRISDEIEARIDKENIEHIVSDIIVKNIKKHKKILYNGNNYCDEWRCEAQRRGLLVRDNSVDAYECLLNKKIIELCTAHGVLSEAELLSRYEINLEDYSKTVNIEALAARSIARKQILPAVMRYAGKLADYANSLKKAGIDGAAHVELAARINALTVKMCEQIDRLDRAIAKAGECADRKKRAVIYRDLVRTAMEELRVTVDELEMIIEKKEWPFPSYGDMLYYD